MCCFYCIVLEVRLNYFIDNVVRTIGLELSKGFRVYRINDYTLTILRLSRYLREVDGVEQITLKGFRYNRSRGFV